MSEDQLDILEYCEPEFDKVPYLQNSLLDVLAVRKFLLAKQDYCTNLAPPSTPKELLTPDEENVVLESQIAHKELLNPYLIPLYSEKDPQPHPGIFGALDIAIFVPEECCDPNLIQCIPSAGEKTHTPIDSGMNVLSIPIGCSREQTTDIANPNEVRLPLDISRNGDQPLPDMPPNLQVTSSWEDSTKFFHCSPRTPVYEPHHNIATSDSAGYPADDNLMECTSTVLFDAACSNTCATSRAFSNSDMIEDDTYERQLLNQSEAKSLEIIKQEITGTSTTGHTEESLTVLQCIEETILPKLAPEKDFLVTVFRQNPSISNDNGVFQTNSSRTGGARCKLPDLLSKNVQKVTPIDLAYLANLNDNTSDVRITKNAPANFIEYQCNDEDISRIRNSGEMEEVLQASIYTATSSHQSHSSISSAGKTNPPSSEHGKQAIPNSTENNSHSLPMNIITELEERLKSMMKSNDLSGKSFTDKNVNSHSSDNLHGSSHASLNCDEEKYKDSCPTTIDVASKCINESPKLGNKTGTQSKGTQSKALRPRRKKIHEKTPVSDQSKHTQTSVRNKENISKNIMSHRPYDNQSAADRPKEYSTFMENNSNNPIKIKEEPPHTSPVRKLLLEFKSEYTELERPDRSVLRYITKNQYPVGRRRIKSADAYECQSNACLALRKRHSSDSQLISDALRLSLKNIAKSSSPIYSSLFNANNDAPLVLKSHETTSFSKDFEPSQPDPCNLKDSENDEISSDDEVRDNVYHPGRALRQRKSQRKEHQYSLRNSKNRPFKYSP